MTLKSRKADPMSAALAWVYCVSIIAAAVLVIYFNGYYGGHH